MDKYKADPSVGFAQAALGGGQPYVSPFYAPNFAASQKQKTLGAGATATAPVNTAVQTANYDPAAAAAAAKAAADAKKAGELRTGITSLVNNIKDIFNQRYGQVDASAVEQTGKLNDRFTNEAKDVATQVAGENDKAGATYAAGGTFDSSYRGNTVDTITKAGEAQVRDLGQELQDNLAKIASWVTSQKTNYDAQKGGLDTLLSRIGEEADPGRLTEMRNQLDARITELKGGAADNNTQAQNLGALETIAPSSQRAVQLKTTLSQIVQGNANPALKNSIGTRLIQNAGLSAAEQEKLLQAFSAELSGADKKEQA